MMHDLVIRLATKYLYKRNQTLAKLHLISRRFYGLREMFVKQINNVILKMESNGDTIMTETVIVSFTFISPVMRYVYKMKDPKYNHLDRLGLSQWRENILSSNEANLLFGIGNINRDDERGETYLSRSVYGKSFADCLAIIIDDPRCWR